ncbi:MAG: hypothetical protein ACI8P3_001066 [Saprospiraceae bacterium]|jgi:hypothetical protein
MKNTGKILLYGFLIWLIPFLIAFGILSIHENNRPLFESIMAVTVAFVTVLFSVLFFQNKSSNYLTIGILSGLIWFGICFGIDLIMFSWGPMEMPFWAYVSDIGVTYLIIPVVTIGMGWLLKSNEIA